MLTNKVHLVQEKDILLLIFLIKILQSSLEEFLIIDLMMSISLIFSLINGKNKIPMEGSLRQDAIIHHFMINQVRVCFFMEDKEIKGKVYLIFRFLILKTSFGGDFSCWICHLQDIIILFVIYQKRKNLFLEESLHHKIQY
jgi:hypothetical protein